MMKSVLVVAVMGLAFMTFTGIGHATNCEDLLGDNIYRCEGKNESDIRLFNECFRFNSTTPSVSTKFDLYVDGLGTTLGCSCKAKGSFTNPTWGDSKEWECVAPNGYVWAGKVAGKGKISKVHAVSAEGSTYIFNCVVDPACVVGPGATVETLTVYGTENQ